MKIENKKVFFGENGLTSTSANFIANKAKEMVENLKINNLSFVKTTVKPLDSNEETVIATGYQGDMNFEGLLEKIGQLHALEAWLREGIKAKQSFTDYFNRYSIDDWANENGVQIPQFPRRNQVEDDDFMATVSEHDLVEHYKAQSYASVIGKFIHPGGVFDNARNELKKYLEKPTELAQGTGKDYLYTHTAIEYPERIEEIYFNLQDKHREYQAEVNKLMYDKETWDRDMERKYGDEYRVAYQKYNEDFAKVNEDFKSWRDEQLKKVQDWKIVIPKSLKKIYDEVNKK